MGTLKLNKQAKKGTLEVAEVVVKAEAKHFANTENVHIAEETSVAEVNELVKADAGFVEEIKDLRTENETVYRRNDRTIRKIITASPTRYRDENGELKNIKNTLTDNGDEIINSANSFKIRFNKDGLSGKIFDLQKGNKVLTLSSVNSSRARGHACGCTCELCVDKENTVLATLDDGTEIQYEAMSDRIKENIIVKERQDRYEYNFTLNIGDLKVEEGEHNDLLLKDAETGETEFRIPAPYMYDANKVNSDKVSYEIDVNGDELAIKVIADADFINAEDRVLPVIIDPQIIDQKNVYDGIIYGYKEGGEDHNNKLKASYTEDEETEVFINYTAPNSITEGQIIAIKLVMRIDTGMGKARVKCTTNSGERIYGTGEALIEGDIFNAGENDTDIEFKIGIGGIGKIEITCNSFDGKNSIELYAPYFVIDYVEFPEPYIEREFEINNHPMIREFDFTDKAKGYLYTNFGGVSTSFKSLELSNFVVPINIEHFNKIGLGESEFGLDWRTSLSKKLESHSSDNKSNTVYLYVDELGDKYAFTERYYYMDGDNIKLLTDKGSISIDINGSMTYNGLSVYKYQSCNDLTLIPEITDFKNYDLVQQKNDELVQLEDYVNQLKPSLQNYAKIEIQTGKIVSQLSGKLTIDSKTYFDTIVRDAELSPNTYIIMTKSEAIQLQALNANIEQLTLQKRQLLLQKRQILQQVTELDFSSTLSKKLNSDCDNIITLENIKGLNSSDSDSVSQMREHISYQNAISNLILLKRNQNEDTQYQLLLEQIEPNGNALIDKQIAQVTEQRDILINQAKANLEVLKETFTRFFSKLQELELLKKQTPVNYLRDKNNLISGFNKDGHLVLLCDSYGNYVNIVRNEKNLITEIYDSQGGYAKFEYKNNLLKFITDNCGRRVEYKYNNNKGLECVTFPDGGYLKFEYQGEKHIIRSVISDTDLQAKLSEDDYHRVTNIATNSKQIKIGTGITVEKDSFSKTLSNISIKYDYNEDGEAYTTFTSNDKVIERYTFDSYGRVVSAEKIDNNFIRTFQTYAYDTSGNIVKVVTGSDLEDTVEETITYNAINKPVSKESGWESVSDTVKVKTTISYAYDYSGNLIKETATHRTDIDGNISYKTEISNYSYNANGSLILKEKYVVGEEQTSGRSFIKNVYDERGNKIKTVSWNSLDSTTKFHNESERAESGQVMATRDETGEISAEYGYVDGTNVVNSVKYPNGSTLSYGRDPNSFKVTGITLSTEDGEANATDIKYTHGLPVEVTSGNLILGYSYDYSRRKTAVSLNGVPLAKYSYKDYTYNESKKSCTFGEQTTVLMNGTEQITILQSKTGVVDTVSGRMKATEVTKINGTEKCRKEYDENGRLASVKNDGTTISYVYDSYDNIIKISCVGLTESYDYNEYGEVRQKTFTGSVSQTYTYDYKDSFTRDLNYITFGSYKFKPLTDVNGRKTGKEIYNGSTKLAAEYITYRKVGDHATNMPATVWFGSGSEIQDSIKYKYDKCSNISEINENGHIVARYAYDSINRLVREDNKAIGKTTVFAYDNNGNITERCEYAYTSKSGEELSEQRCTHFSYDYEGDRLVSYNGTEIKYNSLGNPTMYRGKNIVWQYGTRLAKYGSTEFTYDGLGRRTKKGSITYIYDNDGRLLKQSNGLEFVYDNAGVVGVIYGGAQYFYRRDAQGNIIGILDSDGGVVVKYVYDAWGNHGILDTNGNNVESGIGYLNPFRYRGYYYDNETELYYLQTRYYDPEVGRFISQDSIEYADPETINGLNLYAYCGNNPVMGYDPTGEFLISFLIAIAAGAVIGGLFGGVTAVTKGDSFLSGFLSGALVGGVLGGAMVLGGAAMLAVAGKAVAGIGILATFGAKASFLIGTAAVSYVASVGAGIGAYAIQESMNGREINKSEMWRQGLNTGLKGLLSYGTGMVLAAAGAYPNLLATGKMTFVQTIQRSFNLFLHYGISRAIASLIIQTPWKLLIQ